MIICDLCGKTRGCLQKEIDGKEYDICSECWNLLAHKLREKAGRLIGKSSCCHRRRRSRIVKRYQPRMSTKRTLILSITHKFGSDEEAEFNVGEAGQVFPDDLVPLAEYHPGGQDGLPTERVECNRYWTYPTTVLLVGN